MKIKLSFVTNSSSSAFIVAFPERIKFLDDVENYIYPEEKAEVVFNDAVKQKPFRANPKGKLIRQQVFGTLESGYFDGAPSYSDEIDAFRKNNSLTYNESYNRFYDDFEKAYIKKCYKVLNPTITNFLKKAEGQYIYFFEYGDEDGEFMSEMEHGNTFKKLHHLTVSKH
jgi:hypothetical protein